ncbi:unnamed protein product [Rotaria magnacalcarata]|uniref:Transposase n=2 Tax=Rotaria magnacalcarata TaxID=392030 RepID=A0A816PUN3_9BILA|nr:unnamed protein product [Rotaria magnacalcarata]CAF4344328.1 unnamed protein product [Rotaria magnacalcarata]CAF4411663.1 unnamed protein product [Rotaria magnacalcarata]
MSRPRTVRTAANIHKVKQRHDRLRIFSCRKIARDLRISRTSAQRSLKDDLKLKSYKEKTQPKTSEAQKAKRLKFANWIRTNFRKEDTLRFLFSDEKMFDIDGVYNSKNERIWAPSRVDADVKGGIRQVHTRSTPCGSEIRKRQVRRQLDFSTRWRKAAYHRKTQDWCRTHLPCFIDKDHWPPNSPDLNPLDYCIWDEFAGAINWDLVTSNTAFINELKRSVKKIRPEVVFESCASWTNRLYRLKQANGNCLNK